MCCAVRANTTGHTRERKAFFNRLAGILKDCVHVTQHNHEAAADSKNLVQQSDFFTGLIDTITLSIWQSEPNDARPCGLMPTSTRQ